MQTIQLSDAKAREIFPSASKEMKALLEDSFPKGFFSEKITDRVKTFEDACKELGVRPGEVIAGLSEADEIAYRKLKVIVKALNEGWKPDWSNGSEYKYWPWYDLSSGSGLAFNVFGHHFSFSSVGSRLCFKSRALCEYAAKQFIDIYTEFLIIK